MIILLRTLWFSLPVFSSLINFIQAIITSNTHDNHTDLLTIIHDMCNAHKKVLPELNYSKKIIPHNTFYILNTGSTGTCLKKLYPKYQH